MNNNRYLKGARLQLIYRVKLMISVRRTSITRRMMRA